jgi:hypothetical protein
MGPGHNGPIEGGGFGCTENSRAVDLHPCSAVFVEGGIGYKREMHVLKEQMVPLTRDAPEELDVGHGIVRTQIEARGVVQEQVGPSNSTFLTVGIDLSVHSIRYKEKIAVLRTAVPKRSAVLDYNGLEVSM